MAGASSASLPTSRSLYATSSRAPRWPYAIGLTGFAGIELSRRLGNLSGGLPFTLVFGRDGALLQRRMGETSYEQLAGWARDIA